MMLLFKPFADFKLLTDTLKLLAIINKLSPLTTLYCISPDLVTVSELSGILILSPILKLLEYKLLYCLRVLTLSGGYIASQTHFEDALIASYTRPSKPRHQDRHIHFLSLADQGRVGVGWRDRPDNYYLSAL